MRYISRRFTYGVSSYHFSSFVTPVLTPHVHVLRVPVSLFTLRLLPICVVYRVAIVRWVDLSHRFRSLPAITLDFAGSLPFTALRSAEFPRLRLFVRSCSFTPLIYVPVPVPHVPLPIWFAFIADTLVPFRVPGYLHTRGSTYARLRFSLFTLRFRTFAIYGSFYTTRYRFVRLVTSTLRYVPVPTRLLHDIRVTTPHYCLPQTFHLYT